MDDKIATCYTRVFSQPDGQRVMEHLEKLFRENTDNCDAEALRYTAGQRSVIKHLHKLIEKGRGNE